MRNLLLVLILACAVTARASDSTSSDESAKKAWAQVPGILDRIVPPKFPRHKFPITKYGAVGDGATDCTEAFRKAIEDCTSAGGGDVVVSGGTFLTGAIHLKNNVNLYVEKGATILFSTNTDDYLPPVFARYEGTEVMNYSPFIYAFEQTNIAITGKGTLDGQGKFWHQWRSPSDPKETVNMASQGVSVDQRIFGKEHRLRPNFVVPLRCRNVLIEDIHIVDSPMWVLNPVYCTNVTVRNVTVATTGPNTDGCDPDSCTDVLIKDCDFSDGDDCISVKSGRDRDGQKINIPCQNVVIQDCEFRAGHGGVALGSETSGGIQNVFVENCHFDSPDLEMAMRFKTNPARGGYVKNIYFRDCDVKMAKVGIHMTLRYSSSGAMEGGTIPFMGDIDIQDSVFKELTKQPVFIEGWSPSNPITNVSIINCKFLHAAQKSFITNATDIVMEGSSGY